MPCIYLNRGKIKCEGLETKVHVACLRNNREPGVAEVKGEEA